MLFRSSTKLASAPILSPSNDVTGTMWTTPKRERPVIWSSRCIKLVLFACVALSVLSSASLVIRHSMPKMEQQERTNRVYDFWGADGKDNRLRETRRRKKRGDTTPGGGIVYLTNELHTWGGLNSLGTNRKRKLCPTLFHSLKSLSRYFPRTKSHPSPVVYILHDAVLTDTTRLAITQASPFPVVFHSIHFERSQENMPTGLSEQEINYRRMCAFWFQHVFELEFLPTYVMRLDTDTCLTSPIPMNPFQYMQKKGIYYMWHSTFVERPGVIRELQQFVAQNPGKSITDSRVQTGYLWTNKGEMDVFSTNLEWIYMPAFRNTALLEWKEMVKRNGGLFRNRWGDAPLRTVAVSKFFNTSQVSRFCNFSYNHSVWEPFGLCDETKGKRLTDAFGWTVAQ